LRILSEKCEHTPYFCLLHPNLVEKSGGYSDFHSLFQSLE
jgi:hypothetical protein